MSNPYIGFGRLVWYLISGAIYTFILIRVLFFVYGYMRRFSSRLFFSTDEEEVAHERFAYAKTWYGFFIIVSLLAFLAIAIVIGLRIWGWPVGFDDIWDWLNQELFSIAGWHEGKSISNSITIISLMWVIIFALSGFFIAHAMNRYVLKRIFELLLVDVGVQNTIVSITEYLIIIIAIFFGFYKAGLGSLVVYILGGLILSIGWIIKEPMSDFIAYFILLVQRPIKIGDYVRMDDDIKGVVRKITPRAVVIRKNNSHMIVVPNASVINRPVYNWNYVRNFIAFDDIKVPIAFKEDPLKVKELLVTVINANPNILKNPKPVIRLEEFRDYGYIFLVRGFLSSDLTLEQWEIASDVRLAIIKILRENNIEVASSLEIIRTLSRSNSAQKKDNDEDAF
jgi:small-conductance mechanosensitive channel